MNRKHALRKNLVVRTPRKLPNQKALASYLVIASIRIVTMNEYMNR